MSDKSENTFFQKVYQVTQKIPVGRVTSFGAIAKFLGAAQSARMVGWAMNTASKMEDVPAHRVVNRNGLLTGRHHFSGSFAMQRLLEAEGIQVEDNQVVSFGELFWDPSKEIRKRNW